jgi:hypothetical protein
VISGFRAFPNEPTEGERAKFSHNHEARVKLCFIMESANPISNTTKGSEKDITVMGNIQGIFLI